MLSRLSKVICGLMITMGLVLQPSSARGSFVNIMSGYDLLYTVSATFDFKGVGGYGFEPFVSVPLVTYNFGGGPQFVGATDTILHRLDPVIDLADGASQTINVKMVALSLQSQNQLNIFGQNEYFKTVNVSDLGSTMTIHNSVVDVIPQLDEFGTFDSEIKIAFELEGVTSGLKTPTITKTFQQTGAFWTHLPPPGAILINGVNSNLNGLNHANDFFSGYAFHDSGDSTHVTINSVPEPTSVFAIGLACLAAGGRFARKRRLQQAS